MEKHPKELAEGLNISEAELILENLKPERTVSRRIEKATAWFLGRPYVEGSLGGGPDSTEDLRILLDAFDCVTFMETVMAFALAQSVERVVEAV